MHLIQDDILRILEILPDESDILDYKESFYPESHYAELIRDVISMLNCPVQVDEPRVILCGITDHSPHELKGIPKGVWKDGNEYQNLFKCILPEPRITSGTIDFAGKRFGYFYIYPYDENGKWVYEVGQTYISKDLNGIKKPVEKYIAVHGTAYIRSGTVNTWLNESGRIALRKKRERLDYRKKEILAPKASNDQAAIGYMDVKRTLALVGAFNEKSNADRAFVEKIYGDSFELFLRHLRNLSVQEQGIVSFWDNTGTWYCKNHLSILQSISSYFYTDHLENFLSESLKVYHSADSLFDRPVESRFRIINLEEKDQYSTDLRKRIAETLAILGNYNSNFPQIDHMKRIKNSLYDFENQLFRIDTWKVLASMAEELPFLAEASPEGFFSGVHFLCDEKADLLKKLIEEDAAAMFMTPLHHNIITAIKSLALLEEYFSEAVMCLVQLSKYGEKFKDAVCEIITPWYPLTYADVNKRIGVFKGIVRENPQLVWSILIKLLSDNIQCVGQTVYPHYLPVKHFAENRSIPGSDYMNVINNYVDILCSNVNGDLLHIEDLIRIMKNVSVANQKKVIEAISDNLAYLNEQNREKVWNLLLDYINQQTKYPSRVDNSSKEGLLYVEKMVKRITVDEAARNRRLFQKNQGALFQEKYGDNWEKERIRIQREKESLVRSIYAKSGIQKLIAFAHSVELPLEVGMIAGSIINESDLISCVKGTSLPIGDPFIQGVLRNSPEERILHIVSNFSPDKKVDVLRYTTLCDAAVEDVSSLEENYRDVYWNSKEMGPYDLQKKENLEIAIKELCNHKDKEFGLMILSESLKSEPVLVTSDFILSILIDLKPSDNHILNGSYYIQNMFAWLYQQKNLPIDKIVAAEFKYLSIIDENPKCQPRYIYRELASAPESFTSIIKVMVQNPNLFSASYNLLNHWRIIPGTRADGLIDGNKLTAWYEKVTHLLDGDDLRKTANSYFGHLLFYAPNDRDGFFIDRTVAKLLNSPEGEVLRHGYSAEAFNSRGVHCIDYTGEAEYKIAREYKEKADAAEAEGYSRFAKTLRCLADDYRQEGDEHKKEGEARKRLE